MVMRHLGSKRQVDVQSFLRRVMTGQVGTELKEADSQEPGLRASAAILLAGQGVKNIKPEIEKILPTAKTPSDKAALELGLALLGDPAYLKGEQFKLQSYTIGYGGLQAIEQFDGIHGLDILCLHAINHPWGAVNSDAFKLAKKITKQDWPDTYKGHQAVAKWWNEHGIEFVIKLKQEKLAK